LSISKNIFNGKKVTTKNIARIGNHSDLLKITGDHLAYAKEQVPKYNEEAKKNNKVDMELHIDFAEKIKSTDEAVSASTLKNIGYLYLQRLYFQLGVDKFFTENQDPDYVDEITGEVFTGLRQYGFSKDYKPNPLVEMGLFMDTNGIPISMCIAPGNTNEQTTAIPLEKELVKMFGEGKNKFIYCADAGLSSYHIRNFNSMGGRAFVVAQSVKKLSDALKQAVFNDCDYRLVSDDSPVSIELLKTFDKKDENHGISTFHLLMIA